MMPPLLILRAALTILLWAISNPCLSLIACPSNPCDRTSSEGRSCGELADWVLDGEVVSTRDDGSALLSNVAIVKGTYQVTDDTAVVRGGFSCWVSAHTFERYIGKTIRLYGGSHGVMAFDLMTNVEARLAAEREAKERQLELKLVRSVDCRIPGEKEPSNEIFFRRGQGYFNSNAYPAAKICFLSALKEEQSSKHYKEACYYLGMMYELGKGVSKDMDIAKDWYSKAGL